MKLVTFGDSWVWGDELEPEYKKLSDGSYEYNPNYTEYRHKNNIGGVVNKNYKFDDYINFAKNGASNTHIVYQLIGYINSEYYSPDDLILIGLSSPMRDTFYCNLTKDTVGNWPSWDLKQFLEYADPLYKSSKTFKTWWEGHKLLNLSGHNDVMNYTSDCLSIKGLLKNHKKYIVWQSIDSKFWNHYDVETDGGNWKKLHFIKNTEEGEETICDIGPLTKEDFNTTIKKDCDESQIWINVDEKCWREWLQENYKLEEFQVWSGNHPNLFGINIWFDKILRKYIDKILKTNTKNNI
jgi:hypothetical protein